MSKKEKTVTLELTAAEFTALHYNLSLRMMEMTVEFSRHSRRDLTKASEQEIANAKAMAETLTAQLADLQSIMAKLPLTRLAVAS